MSQGFSGLFIGTKGDKTRRFNEVEDQLCRLSQIIGDLRLDVIDFIDQTTKEETAFEEQMGEVADQLEAARDHVWTALHYFHDSLLNYIAEGYPGLN